MSAQYSLAIHLIIPVRTARPQPGLGPALTHGPEPTRAAEPCPPGMAPPPHCLLQVPTPRGKGPPGAPCRALPPSPSHRAQGLFNGAGRSGTETSAPAAYSGPQSKPRLWRWAGPTSQVPRGSPRLRDGCSPGGRAVPGRVCVGGNMLHPKSQSPSLCPFAHPMGKGPCYPQGNSSLLQTRDPFPLLMGARHWFSEP